jgi:hypothetical protein
VNSIRIIVDGSTQHVDPRPGPLHGAQVAIPRPKALAPPQMYKDDGARAANVFGARLRSNHNPSVSENGDRVHCRSILANVACIVKMLYSENTAIMLLCNATEAREHAHISYSQSPGPKSIGLPARISSMIFSILQGSYL